MFNFLKPAWDSVRGEVNIEELWRVTLLSIAAGGSFWNVITSISLVFGTWITDPVLLKLFQDGSIMITNKDYMSLTLAIVAFITDYIRRKYYHGDGSGNTSVSNSVCV